MHWLWSLFETWACTADPVFNKLYARLTRADGVFVVSAHYAPIPAKLCMLLEKIEQLAFLPRFHDETHRSPLHKRPIGIIFGLITARPHVYEASGLGAAIDAAVGLGLHPGFETAVREMTHTGDVFEPNPQTRGIYERLYQRVYKRMYERLKPLYEEIRHITGYPSQPGK